MGPPGCAGEQCRRGCHPPAGRRHGRSNHEDLCRERAWPELARRGGASLFSGGEGNDINVSSTFGHKPVAGLSHYAASKAALEHLTRCWALELAPHGVRVNAIAAGPTESGALTGMMGLSPEQAAAIKEQERERIPLKRRGNPGDVARWIVSLADPASEWMTGQLIAVDGGLGLT